MVVNAQDKREEADGLMILSVVIIGYALTINGTGLQICGAVAGRLGPLLTHHKTTGDIMTWMLSLQPSAIIIFRL